MSKENIHEKMARLKALGDQIDKEFRLECSKRGLDPSVAMFAPMDYLCLGPVRKRLNSAKVVNPLPY